MSRDQRAASNPALLFAQDLAAEKRLPLTVAFCLAPSFLGATIRHYGFMIKGLIELEATLASKNIGFTLLPGEAPEVLPAFLKARRAAALFTDFDPLRIKRQWLAMVVDSVTVQVYEVDAHNIVPCWLASSKLEWGAYTLRPKLHRAFAEFLVDLPPLRKHPYPPPQRKAVDWRRVERGLKVDRSAGEVSWLEPGEKAARRALGRFIQTRLSGYDQNRNDPNLESLSDLSPYLHFGQLSPLETALAVSRADAPAADRAAFIEQLIVRRELADNFCYYNPNYDSFTGLPEWARITLNAHRHDPRPYLYSRERLETADTHDDLWNAAQTEMVQRGKMHGYMRMYWAKKILEWTASPEEALATAIYLNDRYELDGRDPNGYAGIAWSIGGVHDRPWKDRPVFGKVRYMNYQGARRKFDVKGYVNKVTLSVR